MARQPKRVKLTKTVVEGAMPPGSGEVYLRDSEVLGFAIRIRSSGSRTYIVEYRTRIGLKRRVTLGAHGRRLTVDQARQLARQILANVAYGGDPARDRQEERNAPTVGSLAPRYMEHHANVKKKQSSAEADARLLRLYIIPALGPLVVTEVTSNDVASLHISMKDKPVQANRVLALLSKMFSLAERWKLRPPASNPCRGIDAFPEKRRTRFLSSAEIARLGEVLDQEEKDSPFIVLAIRLLLLTGARRDEILTLRWEFVDFSSSLLHLPDSKTGAKVIPLPPPACALLERAPRIEGNPYVIPGRREGGRLVGLHKPWSRIRSQAGLADVRVHDLRHSFASVGVAAGLGLPVLGAILGHRNQATTARYAHLHDDPRRTAAAQISGTIAAALSSARRSNT